MSATTAASSPNPRVNPKRMIAMLSVGVGLVLTACAASKSVYVTDPPTTVAPADVHARIDELAAAITLQQSQAGWANAPRTAPLFPMDPALPMADQAGPQACPGSRSLAARCTKMCEFASSICHNADEICKLADQVGANLGRDDWAKQKCGSAAIACQQGQMRCCGCDGSNGTERTP